MLEEELDIQDAQKQWGDYVLYRDGLGEKLDEHLDRKRTWKETERGQGIVGVSFSTDCYMDGRAGRITRNVVDALTSHKKYTRVLTRNPILALQDLDVFKSRGEFVTIGSSIPSMNQQHVGPIEPNAPAPQHRLRGLKEFNKHGVNTYVSMSPTYPTQSRGDLKNQLELIAECDPDIVFHEPINPRGANFKMTVEAAYSAGETELAKELERLQSRERWVEYSLDHLSWVQEIGRELDLSVHLWPDDLLIRETSSEWNTWLNRWKERQSVESFADRPTPEMPIPEIPERR